MNFRITQENGLVINMSYNGFTIHISFNAQEQSTSITIPRRETYIEYFKKIFQNVLVDDNEHNGILDIEGLIFDAIVYVERTYSEPTYLLKINNFKFNLSLDTFQKLIYFFENIRELKKEEINKEDFSF